MIHGRGLTKAFGSHRVLDGIDLDVRQGERVALLGLNGAGKTTFMRCLLGIVPFEGRLSIDAHSVGQAGRAAKALIGYVPQRPPHLEGTLNETITFFTRLRGIDATPVIEQLEALGLRLAEHGQKPIRTLSGGMLQKTLLALALGADVRVLLLDEPTANLDARTRRDFLSALERVSPDTTVLLASHRFADVTAVAQRLLVLHRGRLVFDGSLDELWRRTKGLQRVGVPVDAFWREQQPTLEDLLEGLVA